jgi:Ni/Fe-hydrogenase subunit HybB-like protein
MEDINILYRRTRPYLLALAGVGLLAFLLTLLLSSPERAWANLLLGNYFFLQIALFGTVFVALNYVFNSGWAVVFRRLPEAMSAYLPVGAALMLLLLLGLPQLYLWARPEEVAHHPLLLHKAAYLNVPGFILRLVLAFGVWITFSLLLRGHSQQQDPDGVLKHTRKKQTLSAVFMMLFMATFVFTSVDWLMSLEPEWFSSMFPVYTGAGLLLGGTAALSIGLLYLRRRQAFPGITDSHPYELARMLCATSTFWMYIWFSQYMLIYYANIPEESAYYAHRLVGSWSILFVLNPVLNWLIPLVILLPGTARRSPQWLMRAAVIVLIGRWLDIYLMVMPSVGNTPRIGLPEIFIFAGLLALFVFAVLGAFRSAPPIPAGDPYLAESVKLNT